MKLMNGLKKYHIFALFASKINEALKKVFWSQVQTKQKGKVHSTTFLKTIIAVAGTILRVIHVCTAFIFAHASICGQYSS